MHLNGTENLEAFLKKRVTPKLNRGSCGVNTFPARILFWSPRVRYYTYGGVGAWPARANSRQSLAFTSIMTVSIIILKVIKYRNVIIYYSESSPKVSVTKCVFSVKKYKHVFWISTKMFSSLKHVLKDFTLLRYVICGTCVRSFAAKGIFGYVRHREKLFHFPVSSVGMLENLKILFKC